MTVYEATHGVPARACARGVLPIFLRNAMKQKYKGVRGAFCQIFANENPHFFAKVISQIANY